MRRRIVVETRWLGWEKPIRHQAAIAGRVTDDHTGKAIGGARVEITAAPPEFTARLDILARGLGSRWVDMAKRPDRTRTMADGHYHFLNLPAGPYTLTVSQPTLGTRRNTAAAQAAVSIDDDGVITMAEVDVELSATTIKGRITKQPDEPVGMAEVLVMGSGERTFSDDEGIYRLAGLEKGARTVRVDAEGFEPVTTTVTLDEAGDKRTVDISLA